MHTATTTGEVKLPRKSNLKKLIEEGRVVRITAADFNGKQCDGSPVEVVGDINASPGWLIEALTKQEIKMSNIGGTDYLSFCVNNQSGAPVWASPGDFIVQVPSESGTHNSYIVVQDAMLKLLGVEDFMDLLGVNQIL